MRSAVMITSLGRENSEKVSFILPLPREFCHLGGVPLKNLLLAQRAGVFAIL